MQDTLQPQLQLRLQAKDEGGNGYFLKLSPSIAQSPITITIGIGNDNGNLIYLSIVVYLSSAKNQSLCRKDSVHCVYKSCMKER